MTSPIARALVGKNEGDVVEVAAPAGRTHIRDHRRPIRHERPANGLMKRSKSQQSLVAGTRQRPLREARPSRGLALPGSLQARADPARGQAAAARHDCRRPGCSARRLEPVCSPCRCRDAARSSQSICWRCPISPGVSSSRATFRIKHLLDADRCSARRPPGRPCYVRHGPKHERHRCSRSASLDESRRARARFATQVLSPAAICW